MEWEFAVLDWFQSIQQPVLTKIFGFITMLGEAGWFWILLGVILLISRKTRHCGIAVLAALLLDLVLANIILKPLVARPRPCWIRDTVELLIVCQRTILFLRDTPWLLLQPQGHCCLPERHGDVGLLDWPFSWESPVCIFMCIFQPMCLQDWCLDYCVDTWEPCL